MSSSYLLNLKINQLQQEINGIGNAVGYFFNVTSPNGLTIDGSDTAVNIAAPDQNDIQYCFSNIQRSGSFQTSAISGTNANSTVMYYGISKDVNQVFPNASSPSMAMCDWGLLIDNQTGSQTTAVFLIENGVRKMELNPVANSPRIESQITYDGTTLKFFVNGVELPTYRQTVELTGGYFLVAGSFFGGVLNSITWTGTGGTSGGGGSNDNLQMILANGNDAGNQDILNVRNLSLNNYLNIGNAVGQSSQIHLNFDSGNSTTGHNWQIVASNPSNPTIDFQLYNNNALVGTPFGIESNLIVARQDIACQENIYTNSGGNILADGQLQVSAESSGSASYNIYGDKTNSVFKIDAQSDESSSDNLITISPTTFTTTFSPDTSAQISYANVLVGGQSGGTPINGRVFDTAWTSPSIYIPSSVNNTSYTPTFSSPYSLFSIVFQDNVSNIYNDFTSFVEQLLFDVTVAGSGGFAIGATFYISDVENEPFDQTYPIAKSAQVNLGTDGTRSISQSRLILTNIFESSVTNLYLTVVFNGGQSGATVSFSNFNLSMYTTAIAMPIVNLTIL